MKHAPFKPLDARRFSLSPRHVTRTQNARAVARTRVVRFDFRFPNGEDGEQPYAGVLFRAGKVFGTTSGGGSYDEGIVFEITPPADSPNGSGEKP